MKQELAWDYETMWDRLNAIPNGEWAAFFALVYATGAREGEALQVKKEDVFEKETPNGNFVYVNLLTEKNKIQANRHIPIALVAKADNFEGWLALYIKEKAKLTELGKNLFLKGPEKDSTKLRKIRKYSNKYLGRNCHFLRHCRLTHMVTKFDLNEFELVKFAGWTDSRPAKTYIHLKTSDLEKKMHPMHL